MPLLVAVAYLAAAKFGFSLAFATKQVTAIWPPTGIAIAALLLYGYRVWPGIWLGAFASNALSSEPVWTAAAIATGNTLAPVFGAYLLRRFGFQNELERVRDVVLLVVCGSAVAMTVSATNGVICLALAGIVPWSSGPSTWLLWWTGDAMGVLFVAPLLLAWITSGNRGVRSDGGGFELALLSVTLLAASWVSFLSAVPLRLSVYPFIIWTALRFRQRETAAAIAVIGGIAIWATSHNLGPWVTGSLDLRLIQLDSWMSVFAFTGLVLAAVTAEKRAARTALDALLERTQHSVETLQTAFLPAALPQRSGLRTDALYIPAEREALIGGDWYDAFKLPDGRIVFSIGDVAGHGLDAAVAGASLRRSIFAAAFEAREPAEILARVDRNLRLAVDAPITAIVAIISEDLSEMSYASAGASTTDPRGAEYSRASIGLRRCAVRRRGGGRGGDAYGGPRTRCRRPLLHRRAYRVPTQHFSSRIGCLARRYALSRRPNNRTAGGLRSTQRHGVAATRGRYGASRGATLSYRRPRSSPSRMMGLLAQAHRLSVAFASRYFLPLLTITPSGPLKPVIVLVGEPPAG